MVGARRGSPLIIGIGDGENFLASDANAIVAHTRQVVYLNDYDVATVTAERFRRAEPGRRHRQASRSASWNSAPRTPSAASYAHFMLKEIFEQPRTVENALRGRVDFEGATARFGGLNMSGRRLRSIERIVIAASGTSWHAALVGEYLIEELAHLPVEVEFAHEFCYRNAPLAARHRAARHLPIRRNRRHPGRPARSQAPRPPRPGHRQRRRQHHRPRIRRRHLHARRPGNRRRLHQGLRLHADHAHPAGRAPGPHADALRRAAPWKSCDALEAVPEQIEAILAQNDAMQEARPEIRQGRRLLLPGPRLHLSHRPGRRAQAQGNLLHPRRRLFRRRDEARPHRAD